MQCVMYCTRLFWQALIYSGQIRQRFMNSLESPYAKMCFMSSMQYPIYSFLTFLVLPFAFLRLLLRSINLPAYRHRWPERLAWKLPAVQKPVIWVHAVSVGEVQAAVSLVRQLQEKYSQYQVYVTTTTPTGSQRVTDLFGDRVLHSYLPYDLPVVVRRFLVKINPVLAIVMETELWPNLFAECRHRSLPVIVANARLSERSARRYAKFSATTRKILSCISQVAAQDEASAARFRQLGMPDVRLQISGNLKYEQAVPADLQEKAEVLRMAIGQDRPVFIAASTHPGEEASVLEAYSVLRQRHAQLLLILVPRHPDRFAQVADLVRDKNYSQARRSMNELPSADTDVYLGDTLGDLLLLYAASDVAFMGGSLAGIGGHNPLEAAAVGRPVVTASHIHNFESVYQGLIEAGAARKVNDVDGLINALDDWLSDAVSRNDAGEKGSVFVAENRGALDRLMRLVQKELD